MLSEKLGKFAVGVLDAPEEVVMNLPEIVLKGDREVFCGAYKGLLEYSGTGIKLSAGGKTLFVTGAGLTIKTIENEEIIICGKIKGVEFL